MNVSELARGAGLSPSGVRWYETVGVLPPAARRRNGYREYSEGDLGLLRMVTTLRRLGLSAVDAGRVARLCLEHSSDGTDVSAVIQAQRASIAARRAELAGLERELLDLEATVASTAPPVGGTSKKAPAPVAVLFLCNANSGRSQMGEALLGQMGGGRFAPRSAGANPKPVSPHAIKVLAELGIDWNEAASRTVSSVAGEEFDYVVTLSESLREECARLPGRHSTLHWELPDPGAVSGDDEQRLAAYRTTREEIAARLRPFVELALRTAQDRNN
ncbi:MAG: MerR family transcriptional regulator [bacterium]